MIVDGSEILPMKRKRFAQDLIDGLRRRFDLYRRMQTCESATNNSQSKAALFVFILLFFGGKRRQSLPCDHICDSLQLILIQPAAIVLNRKEECSGFFFFGKFDDDTFRFRFQSVLYHVQKYSIERGFIQVDG